MGETNGGGGEIRFTTKEMLARIEGKLDTLAMQIQGKADAVSVQSLTSRVETHDQFVIETRASNALLIPEWNSVRERVRKAELSLAKLAMLVTLAGGAGAGVAAAIV